MLPVSKILRCESYVHRTSREAAVVGKNRIVIRFILVPECLSTLISPSSSPTDAVPRDSDARDFLFCSCDLELLIQSSVVFFRIYGGFHL